MLPDADVVCKYDYRGRRVKRSVTAAYGTASSTTTTYTYDGDQVIAEYDGQGTLLRKFVYGPGIDEPVCMIDVTDNNSVYYYFFDGLGSVAGLSDVSGNLVERYTYDVFGKPTIEDADGAWLGQSKVGNPYAFTGRRYDAECGLYYYRAREYDPEIGRFMQVAPIRYEDGMNVYAYVGNNPINRTDPTGLYEWDGPVDPVTKALCKILQPIPYFNCGARALETGWCTGMAAQCTMYCETSGDVDNDERDECRKKCAREHIACVSRGMRRKCEFKFRIKG